MLEQMAYVTGAPQGTRQFGHGEGSGRRPMARPGRAHAATILCAGLPRWEAQRTGASGNADGSGVLCLDVVVDPVQGALDGLLPQAQGALAGLLVHGRLPALVLGPVVDDVLLALPEADGDTGRVGGPQGGGLDDLRPHDGHRSE